MRAFTGGEVVKNAGDTRDVGLIPGREMATHSPVFLPEKFYGQRSLTGYSPWGHRVRHD